MNSQPNNPPADNNRLEYWRNVARSAEQDLERLRDQLIEACDQADTMWRDQADPMWRDAASARGMFPVVILTFRRLADQPADPHQRAQDAYNLVNNPTPGDQS